MYLIGRPEKFDKHHSRFKYSNSFIQYQLIIFWYNGPSAGWQEWMIKYTALNEN